MEGTWVQGVCLNATNINCRKFALLNLPRMKFYNPHLDIKVFRRPWAGRIVQKTYPCTATILKRKRQLWNPVNVRQWRSRDD